MKRRKFILIIGNKVIKILFISEKYGRLYKILTIKPTFYTPNQTKLLKLPQCRPSKKTKRTTYWVKATSISRPSLFSHPLQPSPPLNKPSPNKPMISSTQLKNLSKIITPFHWSQWLIKSTSIAKSKKNPWFPSWPKSLSPCIKSSRAGKFISHLMMIDALLCIMRLKPMTLKPQLG